MRAALVVAALLWPVTLAAAVVDRLDGHPGLAGTAVYVAASRICHQRPDRSFHTAGHQWPVCARCAGLYVGAALGALAGLVASTRIRRGPLLVVLAAAAIPTAATWLMDVGGLAPVAGSARAAAALPLGAALATSLVWIATPRAGLDEPIG